MPHFISLLRGINVSGKKKIKMDALKSLYQSLGFKQVQTYIQSGNVIFKSPAPESEQALSKKIEAAIKEQLGFDVPVLLRTPEQFRILIDSNPFMYAEHKALAVSFLSKVPAPQEIPELQKILNQSEQIFLDDCHLFFHCPTGFGKTKLTNSYIEKKLGLVATTRNWNTVNRLAKMSAYDFKRD